MITESLLLTISLFLQQFLRLIKTDYEASASLTKWIISLLVILLIANVTYIIYEAVVDRKESKRAKKIKADKEAWEAYQDAYKKQ